MRIAKLTKKSYKDTLILDKESDFNVSQWLEDLDEGEEAEHCFGIFSEGKLIGYCTLGYADGALDISTITPDDLLLSDVFVLKEYRHSKVATTMLQYVLQNITEACYLTFLHDDLISFYESFGFSIVPGTDNIMLRKN